MQVTGPDLTAVQAVAKSDAFLESDSPSRLAVSSRKGVWTDGYGRGEEGLTPSNY